MRRCSRWAVLAAFLISACSAHLQGGPGPSQVKVHSNPSQVKVKAK